MKKLILFAAALVMAGQASAYAQSSQHATKKHKRAISAHARWLGHEGGINYRTRELSPTMIAPSYGDDPSAEGRTSGG